MDNVFIVSLITLAVVAVLFLLLPFVYNKFNNVNFTKIFESSNNILEALKTIIANIEIPADKKAILDLITDYATQAVQYAEQLYKSGQLEKDERKQAATDYVIQILELSDVEVTDEILAIISATIESAVLLLPKTSETVGNSRKTIAKKTVKETK
jgi:hypothetical protein